jgi:UDP-glucose 4-epimerase
MRVLVTGGAGFIGSHIVEALLEAGHHVAVVDNLSTGKRDNVPPGVPFYPVDIRDPELADVFARERPEVVSHQAAHVSVPQSVADPMHDASVNVVGLVNVLEQAQRHGARKVILASSVAVYGDPVALPVTESHPLRPLSPYGLSKWVGERYVELFQHLHGLEFTVLRYANVYGPRQDPHGEAGVVSIFLSRMLAGEPVTIYGDGEQTRDFVYVKDVAVANLCALERGDGGIYNVSTGRATSVNHLFHVLAEMTSYHQAPHHGPPRRGDVRHSVLDPARAQTELGWRAEMALAEGLAQTVEHFRK